MMDPCNVTHVTAGWRWQGREFQEGFGRAAHNERVSGKTVVAIVVEEREIVARTIQVEPAKIARRDQLAEEGRCTNCGELIPETSQVRCGCCDPCYQTVVRKDNRRGDLRRQWIREGRMFPAGKGGPKPKHPARAID